MALGTRPGIPVEKDRKRPLRPHELPTVIYLAGSDIQLLVRVPPETVLKAMQGNMGKVVSFEDFYTGHPVHLRVECIAGCAKAVEQR